MESNKLDFVSFITGRAVKLEFANPGDWAIRPREPGLDGWRFCSSCKWETAREELERVGWSPTLVAVAKSMGLTEGSRLLVITGCRRGFYGADRFSAVVVDVKTLSNWGKAGHIDLTNVFCDVVPVKPEYHVEMKMGVEIINRQSIPLLLLAAEGGGLRLARNAWLAVRHPASHEYPEHRLVTTFYTLLGFLPLSVENKLHLHGRYADGSKVFAILDYWASDAVASSIILSPTPFEGFGGPATKQK
jgi:hypothetical protein